MILIDSNILVFAHNIASPQQEKAKEVLFAAVEGKFKAVLTAQNLLEFYSIITNPKRVENPLAQDKVLFITNEYINSGDFDFIYPKGITLKTLLDLSSKYQTRRAEIFDTYLVATM